MLSNKLFSSIGNTDRLYVDDVFSAYTYTGNGSTQTITNGIDLAGKGGMVWIKARNYALDNMVVDTVRGVGQYSSLQTQSASPASNFNVWSDFTSFNSNGFTLGVPTYTNRFNGPHTYISWSFRKAPKFFDVVTYAGNGAGSRSIAHSLGVAPGMVIVKCTSNAMDWEVQHRSVSATKTLKLNTTAAELVTESAWANTPATSSNFTVGSSSGGGDTNVSGRTYVAYLFAHDPSADGIVQCGSYTGTAPSINLGWEPQFVITKCVSFSSAYTGWGIFDSSRGLTVGSDTPLLANSSDAENGTYNSNGYDYLTPTATGFTVPASTTLAGGVDRTYIYLAIRRPNKPPTTGTQVYNAIARTGTGAVATVTGVGFSPDFVMINNRNVTAENPTFDRLRGVGAGHIKTTRTSAENGAMYGVSSLGMDGVSLEVGGDVNYSTRTYINHFFRRAPGFMDVVCSQSTPSSDLSFSHGLGVVPELIIHKDRRSATDWDVWTTAFGGKHYLKLNFTSAATSVSHPSTLTATTVFSGSGSQTSNSPQVCYLFASLPGISKVGSYTGNGSSQTINCGFSTGARFILLKRTDSTGDWYVWDTARGIIAANDPHLSLNTTAAEVTTNDSVDPDASGFIVNQVAATNINVSGGTYLYLAIA